MSIDELPVLLPKHILTIPNPQMEIFAFEKEYNHFIAHNGTTYPLGTSRQGYSVEYDKVRGAQFAPYQFIMKHDSVHLQDYVSFLSDKAIASIRKCELPKETNFVINDEGDILILHTWKKQGNAAQILLFQTNDAYDRWPLTKQTHRVSDSTPEFFEMIKHITEGKVCATSYATSFKYPLIELKHDIERYLKKNM